MREKNAFSGHRPVKFYAVAYPLSDKKASVFIARIAAASFFVAAGAERRP